ncbi:Uncharacterized protein PEX1_086600 [Penicillium expansum]|uniref:Thioredoxin-like fold domain-containing protein n=1 Tax=Penicillium expansum TaxID=27334 RepID=A0A0A2J9N1_PENEN|nr:Uncharacterized protein PEX2_107810 [Penicillium expansum]KGO41748.1 Uncharacterized protein PEXP_107540 [Penicillium expansum]KGO52122.1 Uncharacterized protein PEX2_107810 [Penicillium expansum]KGO56693.1 Uncharacterized protein PEX1_086600 [Penicillium expansum]
MATSLESAPTITVFRGFPEKGCYTWSPFVTKLEARLRFGNISYNVDMGSPPKGPRGKVPYITLERDGQSQSLSDSTLIAKSFIESGHLEDLNRRLSPVEKAQDLSLKALFEDKLCFYQRYERWVVNYYAMRSKILAGVPWPVQVIVGNIIYNKNVRSLQGQGTGGFSGEEIATFQQEIWESVNGLVSAAHAKHRDRDGPFWVWGGDAPTEADSVLFGFVVSGLVCEAAPETKQILHSYPALVEYARRIHDKYFPDYQLWE